jgi:hypothetical protein
MSQSGDGAQCFCKPPWTGVTCSEPLSPLGDSDDDSQPIAPVEDASGALPQSQPQISGISVASMGTLQMPQNAVHDLDGQYAARAMPAADADWTPAVSAANEAQDTQLLKAVLQHEWQIDDKIGALTKRVQSVQNLPDDDVDAASLGIVHPEGSDGLLGLEPFASPVVMQQPKFHAVHSAMASGRSTRRVQVVQRQLPSADSESNMMVDATLVMTKESSLLDDPDSVRFSLWSAMCPDVPCKLKVYIDDITVLDSTGTTLKFTVTPSDPAAKCEEILLDLQGQVESKSSPLYQAFPDIDGKKSEIKLTDTPMLETPPPPTTEPPPPSREVLGAVPAEKPPTPPPASPGSGSASEGAAQAAAEAAKKGEDPGKAAAAGAARGHPLPEKKLSAKSPPMSTTMQCIMNLTTQFFIIFTLYQFVRSYNAANGLTTSKVQQILEQAKDTVQFAPMLCILFVGIRMRALQLTQNAGAPPIWVQQCMQLCAFAVMVQCLLVVCIPMLLGESHDENGEVKSNLVGRIIAGLLTVIRYVAVLALYGGMVGCCVGVIIMKPRDCFGGGKEGEAKEKAAWPDGEPPVSPALACTMNLTVQFFVIYLLLMIVKTVHDFSESKPWFIAVKDKFEAAQNTLQNAATTVFMAPMLCILFISARMRALQINPKTGAPQPWAQMCFYICCYCLLVCTCLTLVPPLIGTPERKATGEYTYKMNPMLGGIVTAARFLSLLGVYGGFTAIIYSMFEIKNPNGPTPPMAPAMQCVQVLCCMFFGIYLIVFILQTVRDFTPIQMNSLWNGMQSTLGTVQFAPMLCVLFIGVRMRAQEVSNGTGAPQGWAQEAMFLCVLSLLVQLVMCLLLPLIAPAPAEVDENGNEKPRKRQGLFSKMFQGLLELIKYSALFMLYGGVVVICFSAFVITPSTANGQGSLMFDGNASNNYFPKVPPMSTTMMCIINLSAQYFIIMSAVIILRKVNDAMDVDNNKSSLVKILDQTKDSVSFAPMLCVLFLGARMRALQLTQNQGAPQPWVQTCMLVCAYAVLVQCLMVLFVGLLLGDDGSSAQGGGSGGADEEDPLLLGDSQTDADAANAAEAAVRKSEAFVAFVIATCLSVIRIGAMLALYAGMTAVCVGILIMTPETCLPKDPEKAKAMWAGSPPPVSPALQCTMFMTIQFFAVYLLIQVMALTIDFLKSRPIWVDPLKSKLIILHMTFQQAADTVVLAPMLCILFIGARMRALQLDPKNGAPQKWAQTLFYVCAYGLLVGTGLILVNPIFATLEPGEKQDDPPQMRVTGPIAIVCSVVRFLCIGCVYGAACGVLYSVFVIQAPDGKPTPPVAPAMLCVIILITQFFVIMAMIFVADAVATYTPVKLDFFRKMLGTCKVTVFFCPMLSVLFVGTRMRAQEITGGKGAPPGYVQDAMFFATFAVLTQLILCFIGPIPVKFIQVVAGLLTTIALFALYGGIIQIIAGLFMMTPEVCDGKGSLFMKYVFPNYGK